MITYIHITEGLNTLVSSEVTTYELLESMTFHL